MNEKPPQRGNDTWRESGTQACKAWRLLSRNLACWSARAGLAMWGVPQRFSRYREVIMSRSRSSDIERLSLGSKGSHRVVGGDQHRRFAEC